MARLRGKRIAAAAGAVGAAVVLFLPIAARDLIEEELLIRRLARDDGEAARRLGELRSVRGIPWLIIALRARGLAHEPAARALSRIGRPAAPALCAVVDDKNQDPIVRGRAAQALGEMGPGAAGAIRSILEFAKEPSQDFLGRSRALMAIARICPGSEDAAEALAKLDLSAEEIESIPRAKTRTRTVVR